MQHYPVHTSIVLVSVLIVTLDFPILGMGEVGLFESLSCLGRGDPKRISARHMAFFRDESHKPYGFMFFNCLLFSSTE